MTTKMASKGSKRHYKPRKSNFGITLLAKMRKEVYNKKNHWKVFVEQS